jgi:hypothetical protein
MGPQGATGFTGPVATLQDDGVPVPGAPHTTENFVGAGVSVTDAGGGVATVLIPGNNLVFRPGGVQGGNVYTVWADLMAAKALIQGKKAIQFDDSISSPCVIPAGVWDMTDTEWVGARPPNDSQARVNISDGASLPNLYQLGSDLFITNLNTTTAPVVIGPVSVTIEIGFSPSGAFCILNNPAGSAPFFDLSSGGFAFFRVQGRFQGDSPMVSCGAAAPLFGNNAGIIMLDNAQIFSNMFAGTNPAQRLQVLYAGTTAMFGNTNGVFAGTVFEPLPNQNSGSPGFLREWYIPEPPLSPSTVALTPATGLGMGTILRFDTTAGDVAQSLPKIGTASSAVGVVPQSTAGITAGILKSQGMRVTIKNEKGANNVNVTPDGVLPDTIEGGTGPLVVPPGGSRTLVSDGIGNWIIVAGWN